MRIAIVIPVYNGASTVGPLTDKILREWEGDAPRIVLVNDDSPDDADRVCRELAERHAGSVVYVRLARNFGEHNAVMAGLRHADADHVVIMDDDFQNPPAEAARLARHAAEHDCDVVYARYEKKEHDLWRNWGSRFNDAVANVLLDKPRDLYLSSFKCVNRFLVHEITRYEGPYPYIDGLILRATRRIGTLTVKHEPRAQGRSSYTVRKLVRLWLAMFVNFSVMPLRISAILGFASTALGLFFGLNVVIERLLKPDLPLGYASLMTALLVFGGAQLAMLGVIGEYLGRLFLTVNRTPQFVVRDVVGAPRDPGAP